MGRFSMIIFFWMCYKQLLFKHEIPKNYFQQMGSRAHTSNIHTAEINRPWCSRNVTNLPSWESSKPFPLLVWPPGLSVLSQSCCWSAGKLASWTSISATTTKLSSYKSISMSICLSSECVSVLLCVPKEPLNRYKTYKLNPQSTCFK